VPGPDGWFVDADILGLFHVLHAARRSSLDDVVSGLTRDFPVGPGMEDVEWMPLVGARENLAVLTRDARQRFRDAEREAIVDNRLGVFAIRSRKHLSTWGRARLVFHRWDDLEDAWATTPRPFVFTVTLGRGLRREL